MLETSTSGALVEDVLDLTQEAGHHDLVEANVVFGCGQVQSGISAPSVSRATDTFSTRFGRDVVQFFSASNIQHYSAVQEGEQQQCNVSMSTLVFCKIAGDGYSCRKELERSVRTCYERQSVLQLYVLRRK
ncbi:unnamed protein product [Lathyrus sativus]|nr:unnamed protein product [Lathyrus sativus]